MSSAKLAAYVTVRDENGTACLLGPDDDVPDWAEAKITNPAAWQASGSSTAGEELAPAPKASKPPSRKASAS